MFLKSYNSTFPYNKLSKKIRSLVNLKANKSSTIKILDENNNITSDSQKIANIFNEHYATLGTKVQQKIPTQEGDYNFYLDKRDKNGRRFMKAAHFIFLQLAQEKLKKLLTN